MSGQKNEGEGNRTASAEYNKSATEFAKSGRAEGAAQEAKRAMDSPEGKELDAAHDKAAAHAKEHDPEEVKQFKKPE